MVNNSQATLPDDAFVVRGGINRPEHLDEKYRVHPSGVPGWSVHSAPGASVAELAVGVPNRQIGVTTVGRVRALGGDVIRTSGSSPHHATLTGLTPEQVSGLLTPAVSNPVFGTG